MYVCKIHHFKGNWGCKRILNSKQLVLDKAVSWYTKGQQQSTVICNENKWWFLSEISLLWVETLGEWQVSGMVDKAHCLRYCEFINMCGGLGKPVTLTKKQMCFYSRNGKKHYFHFQYSLLYSNIPTRSKVTKILKRAPITNKERRFHF